MGLAIMAMIRGGYICHRVQSPMSPITEKLTLSPFDCSNLLDGAIGLRRINDPIRGWPKLMAKCFESPTPNRVNWNSKTTGATINTTSFLNKILRRKAAASM